MKKPEILFEDPHLLVCIKPAGIPVQTRNPGTPDMESILKNHLRESLPSQKELYLAVVHRLDQPVEGILVFAKTRPAAAGLSRQIQSESFGKYYQAVVCGKLPALSGTLTDYLVKDGRTNTSRICTKDTPGAKYAALSYEVLKFQEQPLLSLVDIRLKTGRHHQIRVQMANAGAPLWGDNRYHPEFVSKRGYFPIALCAYKVSFCHPKTGKTLVFQTACHWPQFVK